MSVAFPAPAPDAGPPDGRPAGAPAGRGRSSWSGLLQLGLVTVPVKAYPATGAAPELPTHQLHAGCGRRVRYEKRCPEHGPLEAGALVKGYEYAPGQFLVLDGPELEALRPVQDRALALEALLDPQQLDPLLYAGRGLYLAPDGLAAQQPYAVLAQAMAQRRQAALGRLFLSGRRQLGLVWPAGRLLVLHLLHYPAQLRSGAALEAQLRPAPAAAAEAQLAGALLDAYHRPVRWADCRDDSAERLADLVQARLQGRAPAAPAPEEAPVVSLLEALRRSVAALTPAAAAAPVTAAPPKPRPKARRRPA